MNEYGIIPYEHPNNDENQIEAEQSSPVSQVIQYTVISGTILLSALTGIPQNNVTLNNSNSRSIQQEYEESLNFIRNSAEQIKSSEINSSEGKDHYLIHTYDFQTDTDRGNSDTLIKSTSESGVMEMNERILRTREKFIQLGIIMGLGFFVIILIAPLFIPIPFVTAIPSAFVGLILTAYCFMVRKAWDNHGS